MLWFLFTIFLTSSIFISLCFRLWYNEHNTINNKNLTGLKNFKPMINFTTYILFSTLTSLLKSPAWAASRKISLHSSVFSAPFEYLPQFFTFDIDACTLEILNNCSLRWGEEELLSDSVPFITVSFFVVPLGWYVLNAEFWLTGKVCDSWDWFLVEALFSSCANSAWMLSREAVLATEL